ncbi:hypothetical protein MKX01_040143 [Papaver californicum]|nr:hypothetical protein MKX01_040143 [Papaver californicum]
MAAENGVVTITDEVSFLVNFARMFRAIFVDNHPKSCICSQQRDSMGNMKLKMDEIDYENLTCKYTVSDCNAYGDMVDFLVSECKFVASANDESVINFQVTNNFYPKGDAKMDEEEIKAGMEKAREIFDFVHA